jgi:hypothetical protein
MKKLKKSVCECCQFEGQYHSRECPEFVEPEMPKISKINFSYINETEKRQRLLYRIRVFRDNFLK